MDRFLAWVNRSTTEPPLITAALAYLWLVTLHPFDDGNGRMARADDSPQRFYSLSAQIQRERTAYYDVLERTRKGTLDAVLAKARFWQRWATAPLNERQVKVLN